MIELFPKGHKNCLDSQGEVTRGRCIIFDFAKKLPNNDMTTTTLQLYPYQTLGVEWMLGRERAREHAGGLLLDECGLGKTAQVIATLLQNEQPLTLVVLPVNLIHQWAEQLEKWAPHFRVCIYHGKVPRYDATSYKSAHEYFCSFSLSMLDDNFASTNQVTAVPVIVLTSYGKIINRAHEKKKKRERGRKKCKGIEPTFLHHVAWDRVILDEAHVIRNPFTIRSRYVLALESRIKWVLTATPVHNGIQDFQTLLQFLGLDKEEISHLFVSHPALKKYVKTPSLNNDDTDGVIRKKRKSYRILDMETMRIIKKPAPKVTQKDISLRRTKRVLQEPDDSHPEEPVDERPKKQARHLPPLQVDIVHVRQNSTSAEETFFRNLQRVVQLELFAFNEQNQVVAMEVREQFMFELILRLRQASVNPRLVIEGYKRKFNGHFPLALFQNVQEVELLIDSLTDENREDPIVMQNQEDPLVDRRGRARRAGNRYAHPLHEACLLEEAFLRALGIPLKTRVLIDMLREHRNEKSIVFCEFTEEMPLLQQNLESVGISSVLYDGSMSMSARDRVVTSMKWTHSELAAFFEEGVFFPGVKHVAWEIVDRIARMISFDVVIVQINSGNAGLNMQMCSRVYFTNPNWNPCTEIQAISRAHRCGQQVPVRAVKLVKSQISSYNEDFADEDGEDYIEASSDDQMESEKRITTIDERVLEVQQRKREVMADILEDSDILDNGNVILHTSDHFDANGKDKMAGEITLRDLNFLING